MWAKPCRIRPSGGDHRRRHPHQQQDATKRRHHRQFGNTLARAEVGLLLQVDDLEHLRAQARAAQHAIDPIRIKAGPGRGFGSRGGARHRQLRDRCGQKPRRFGEDAFYVMGRRFGTKHGYPNGQNYRHLLAGR